MTRTSRAILAGLLAIAAFGAGCFEPLALTVGPETPAVAARLENIKVDLVGVNNDGAAEIGAVDPASWFAKSGPGAAMRLKYESTTEHMEFSAGPLRQVVLAPGQGKWKQWEAAKVSHVIVIADPSSSANPDPKAWIRDIRPERGMWKDDAVTIWVDNAGLKLDRSPN